MFNVPLTSILSTYHTPRMALSFGNPRRPKEMWSLLRALVGAARWTKPSVWDGEVSDSGSPRCYGGTCGCAGVALRDTRASGEVTLGAWRKD